LAGHREKRNPSPSLSPVGVSEQSNRGGALQLSHRTAGGLSASRCYKKHASGKRVHSLARIWTAWCSVACTCFGKSRLHKHRYRHSHTPALRHTHKYIHILTHIHTHTYEYTHIYTHTQKTNTQTHAHSHRHTHTHTQTQTHTHTHTFIL
jgi:hypothetical protein